MKFVLLTALMTLVLSSVAVTSAMAGWPLF